MGGIDFSNLDRLKKPAETGTKKVVARQQPIIFTDNHYDDLFGDNKNCMQIYNAYNSAPEKREEVKL